MIRLEHILKHEFVLPRFTSLRTGSHIGLNVTTNEGGGELRLETDDMELAGDILQV